MGLVATIDSNAKKTIATLERRLGVLRDRIENLQNYLCKPSREDANLTLEVVYATATLEIANEFCHEFDSHASGSHLNEVHFAPATNCKPV